MPHVPASCLAFRNEPFIIGRPKKLSVWRALPVFPLAPAWCFTGKELVISTFPQGVRACLSRGAGEKTLADLPGLSSRLKESPGPIALVYYDSVALCRNLGSLYDFVASQLVEANVRFDAEPLAPARQVLTTLHSAFAVATKQGQGL